MAGPIDFDPVEFFKRPQVILRLVCILFAIVVFGCISAGGYDTDRGTCLFHDDSGACHYGVGIGVIAFLGCIIFIAIDSQFDTINNPETKKHVTMADLGFSVLWTFLFFVAFCYLADTWRKTEEVSFSVVQTNNCQAAIAFSFFSVITWAGLSFMAFTKFRRGLQDEYTNDGLPGDSYSSPYASFPSNAEAGGGDPYQSRPFTEETQPEVYNTPTNAPEAAGEYKPPSY